MRVRLEELQRVVERTLNEERAVEALRSEVTRVLGPTLVVEGKVIDLAIAANDRIDILERTGRANQLNFKPSVMVRFLEHGSAELRRLATRVVPNRFINRVVSDKDPSVRAAAARRLSIGAVSEMLKRFPTDDTLRTILKQKKLAEAGIPQPKVQDEPFDMYGDERMGDASRSDTESELSDEWYRTRAECFLHDYGTNIEYCWEELATRRYIASVRATSGVELDEEKLLKAIKELIEEREDRAMERNSLKETVSWLREQDQFLDEVTFVTDAVQDLIGSGLSPAGFVDQANSLFRVQEAMLPPGIRKHRLGEGGSKSQSIPVIGYLPHKHGFRALDERALDMYCEAWNNRQAMHGEPLHLEWSVHPDRFDKVSFSVILK